jgi:hypothetical protein
MRESDTRKSIIKRRGYHKNIKGDKLSLYISNYPIVAEYIKKRIGNPNKVLAELCCGIGVTLGFMAPGFKKVIGVEIDKKILNECKENLRNAGLLKKYVLILGDINDDKILKKIKADIVIYDIPFWSKDSEYKNPSPKSTIERIRKFITSDIIIFCSPKFDYRLIQNELGSCEFQKVYVNGKHDRNHIYSGNLKQKEISEVKLFT